MLKQWNDFLAGTPMTLAGGAALLVSLWAKWRGAVLPVDPAWLAVLICGLPLVYLSATRLVNNAGVRKISSALLISIAMIAAAAIGDLFAAGEVAFIMALGAIIEEKTTKRAQKGLKKLIRLAPEKGRRVKGESEEMVPVREIRVGDVLRVRPGEKIPTDGQIVSGNTSVDQSVLTGESLPLDKGAGDAVLCGTLNRFGAIDVRVTKTGTDSSLHRLIRLIEEAEEKKAPMERIADQWASRLVPVALFIAVAAYFLTGEFVRAVTVLVVFCPCALVLATPTAIMAAIGQATKHGVVIKSGEALENMGKADTVAFDKTGTMTLGTLTVTDIVPLDGETDSTWLLFLVAAAESRSEHPLAKAVVRYAKEQGAPLWDVSDFQMQAGKGISARVDGKTVLCGNERYLRKHGVEFPKEAETQWAPLLRQGKATIFAAVQGTLCGVLAFSDVLRPEARAVVSELRDMNVQTVLLTGDTAEAAVYFAAQIGVDTVHAGLLPEEKVAHIKETQENGRTVCMVGDGVNDAPSLKLADVGVAMADMGSDLAVEAADVALMNDDLAKLPYLKGLANATVQTIRLSISLSLGINFVAILLSVQGVLTPTTGALVHNAGSCFVVLIAALLYDRDFDTKRTAPSSKSAVAENPVAVRQAW